MNTFFVLSLKPAGPKLFLLVTPKFDRVVLHPLRILPIDTLYGYCHLIPKVPLVNNPLYTCPRFIFTSRRLYTPPFFSPPPFHSPHKPKIAHPQRNLHNCSLFPSENLPDNPAIHRPNVSSSIRDSPFFFPLLFSPSIAVRLDDIVP